VRHPQSHPGLPLPALCRPTSTRSTRSACQGAAHEGWKRVYTNSSCMCVNGYALGHGPKGLQAAFLVCVMCAWMCAYARVRACARTCKCVCIHIPDIYHPFVTTLNACTISSQQTSLIPSLQGSPSTQPGQTFLKATNSIRHRAHPPQTKPAKHS